MRKIDKDNNPNGVPISLRLPGIGLFASGHERRRGATTQEKRLDVIAQRKYIESHSDRYKQDDTKEALEAIYHGKCAYCEQRVEAWQVEHYRPKVVYYWLAFSWDNLLAICPDCNQNKGDKFDCEGEEISVDYPPYDLSEINDLRARYDVIEQPKFVNPEVDDLVSELIFEKDGSVRSTHTRVSHTIEQCKLHRIYLNDARRKILDDFRRVIKGEFFKASLAEQATLIKHGLEKLKAEANDPREEFTAFRRYMLQNWVREEILAAQPRA